jgi:hypothetical protein
MRSIERDSDAMMSARRLRSTSDIFAFIGPPDSPLAASSARACAATSSASLCGSSGWLVCSVLAASLSRSRDLCKTRDGFSDL